MTTDQCNGLCSGNPEAGEWLPNVDCPAHGLFRTLKSDPPSSKPDLAALLDAFGQAYHEQRSHQGAWELERLEKARRAILDAIILRPVQTEVCPVCQTVHDKPLCRTERCVVCNADLPPLEQWSMPACPACTDKAARGLCAWCNQPVPAPETGAPPAAELIQSLASFARHNPFCPVSQWKPQDEEDFDVPGCTCGLILLLEHARQYTPTLNAQKTGAERRPATTIEGADMQALHFAMITVDDYLLWLVAVQGVKLGAIDVVRRYSSEARLITHRLAVSSENTGLKTTAERTPKDYAIEHAEYMAQAAEELMAATNSLNAEASSMDAIDRHSHAYRTLESRIYEFRKRAERARSAGDVSGDRG